MRLLKLTTTNFRNLQNQTVQLPSRITMVVGSNGQGKTSLLEAVYLLGHAKSFRTSKPVELVTWQGERVSADPTRVEGVLDTDDGLKTITYQLAGAKRSVYVNGKPVAEAKNFYGQLKVIEFTPDDLTLIKGGPGERRAYIDRLLATVDGAYVQSLVLYQRTLKNRNAILAAGGDTQRVRRALTHWDASLVKWALELARFRNEAVRDLSPLFERHYRNLCSCSGSEAREKAALRYQSRLYGESGALTEEELLKTYDGQVENDLARGRTNFGVHRDDVRVEFSVDSVTKPARISASQGQARSLALALKLAGLEFIIERTGERPILLLDDVESELDSQRQEALFSLVNRIGVQVIVSSTEVSAVAEKVLLEAATLRLSGGLVFEEKN